MRSIPMALGHPVGGRPRLPLLGVVRFDHTNESAPRHNLFHLREKNVTPRKLFLGTVFGLGETHLLMRRGRLVHRSAKIMDVTQ